MQRAAAADADQKESERHYIDDPVTANRFFNADSTIALNIAACSSAESELKKALELERESKDFLHCTSVLFPKDRCRLKKKFEYALRCAEETIHLIFH